MIKKTLFILFSMFLLSSCQANSSIQTKTIETYVEQANQKNKKYAQDGKDYLWSNIVVERDSLGQILIYGNYDNPPKDLGNLETVRASIRKNSLFSSLYYTDSNAEDLSNYIFRDINGVTHIQGNIEFKDVNGSIIPLDEIEEGSVFIAKRSANFTYISPMTLKVSEMIFIGLIEPLNYL